MTEQKNVSLPDDQADYLEEEGLSASNLLQEKIKERRNRSNYSQLYIDNEYSAMTISLTNFPSVVDSRDPEKGRMPIPLYKNQEGELVEEPPVYKDEDHSNEEDVTVWKREDNDEICKVKVENWEEHRDFSLIHTQPDTNAHILLDPKRM